MEIIITDSKYIREVQEEFQKLFPYLKIEFFKSKKQSGKSILKSQLIPGKTTIGTVSDIHHPGIINIDGSRSVDEIECDFQNKFGLYAEVFRKSGGMWIETTLTHHWSLHRQNFEGQQMS